MTNGRYSIFNSEADISLGGMAFGIAGVVVIAVAFASQTIMAWHTTSRSS